MATEKRLIDANALKEKAEPEEVTGEGIVYVQDIDEAPTVDAVEVVRCKDCKYYRPPFCLLNDNKHGWLNHVLPEHFCSYGERGNDG